jgi:hypothetical protein
MNRTLIILMSLALLGGPLLWLLFTQEGQRRTDLFLLPLFGRPAVTLSLAELNSRLGEADIRAKLPDVELACTDEATPYGDRTCTAQIGAFAWLPAEGLTFFFAGGELRVVKLSYRRDVHAEVAAYLTQRFGEGDTSRSGADGAPTLVTNWQLLDGLVLLRAGDLGPREEPALLWLSQAAVTERVRAIRPGKPAAL